jgi:hypothetical protein
MRGIWRRLGETMSFVILREYKSDKLMNSGRGSELGRRILRGERRNGAEKSISPDPFGENGEFLRRKRRIIHGESPWRKRENFPVSRVW